MKRCFSFVVSVVVLLCLMGCSNNYSETDMEYMVSSIGFDKKGEKVNVFVEIIVVNSGENSSGAKSKVLNSCGYSVGDAVYNLHSSLAKPLMLNHCGLLILGESIDESDLKDIFKLCYYDKNITMAIEVIGVKKVEELMKVKPSSNIALGYEISEAIRQYSEFSGVDFKNRFYEIESKRQGKTQAFMVPYFSVSKENYSIDGLAVYKSDKVVLRLDNNETSIYSVMTGSFKKGKMQIDKKSENIHLKSLKYDIDYDEKQLVVNVVLDVDAPGVILERLNREIKKTKIFYEDIYYIADHIYRKKPHIWNKIKDSYSSKFKNAKLSFEVV